LSDKRKEKEEREIVKIFVDEKYTIFDIIGVGTESNVGVSQSKKTSFFPLMLLISSQYTVVGLGGGHPPLFILLTKIA
jgi:hypothetical protein